MTDKAKKGYINAFKTCKSDLSAMVMFDMTARLVSEQFELKKNLELLELAECYKKAMEERG